MSASCSLQGINEIKAYSFSNRQDEIQHPKALLHPKKANKSILFNIISYWNFKPEQLILVPEKFSSISTHFPEIRYFKMYVETRVAMKISMKNQRQNYHLR